MPRIFTDEELSPVAPEQQEQGATAAPAGPRTFTDDDLRPPLRQVYTDNASGSPDEAAKVISTARKLGSDETTVAANLKSAEFAARVPDEDYFVKLSTDSPRTASFYTEPRRMAAGHDSIDTEAALERDFNKFSLVRTLGREVRGSFAGFSAGLTALPQFATGTGIGTAATSAYLAEQKRLTDPNAPKLLDSFLHDPSKLPEAIAHTLAQQSANITATALVGTAAAGATTAAAIGAPVVLSAAAIGATYVAFMGLTSAATKYHQNLQAGVPQGRALSNAYLTGAIQAIPETIGIGAFESMGKELAKEFGQQGAREVTKKMLKSLFGIGAAEGSEEVISAALQHPTDVAMGIEKWKGWEDFSKSVIEAGLGGFVAGAAGGGPSTFFGGVRSVQEYNQNVRNQALVAAQAQQGKDFWMSFGSTLAASKLRSRLPEESQKFVEEVTKDGLIPAIERERLEALLQESQADVSKTVEELGITDSYLESFDTGEPVRIPFTSMSKVIDLGLHQTLADDIEFIDPATGREDGIPSFRQAEALKQEALKTAEAETEAAVKSVEPALAKAAEMRAGYDKALAELTRVRASIPKPAGLTDAEYQQLIKRDAAIAAAQVVTRAQRENISVEQSLALGPRVIAGEEQGPVSRPERTAEPEAVAAQRAAPVAFARAQPGPVPFDPSVSAHSVFVKAQETARAAHPDLDLTDRRAIIDRYIQVTQALHDLRNEAQLVMLKGTDEAKAAVEERLMAAIKPVLALDRMAHIAFNDPVTALQYYEAKEAGREPGFTIKDPYRSRQELQQTSLEERPVVLPVEAIPSKALGLPINGASVAVRQAFTREALPILQGVLNDLGVEAPAGIAEGYFEGTVNPNMVAGLPDMETAAVVARAMQYVFKQDEVWHFRATEPVEGKPTAVLFRFKTLDDATKAAFTEALDKALTGKGGYTILSDKELVVADFAQTAGFKDALDELEREHGERLGIEETGYFGVEGSDGPRHDWGADPEGEALLNQAAAGGPPDIQGRLSRRARDFAGLLSRYDADGIAQRERELGGRGALESTPEIGAPETPPLPGLPASSAGVTPGLVAAARIYARRAGIPYARPAYYTKADPARGARIAQAYEALKHDPLNPDVIASYEALIEETLAQYQVVKDLGIVVEAIPAGAPEPYKSSREMAEDVRRGHLWFYPTDQGYGSGERVLDHPMLQATRERIGDRVLLANDVFRIVHDVFGHAKEGSSFGPDGEENAWQAHVRMYSPLAARAMTAETRGQNSWVNFGPYGEANRKNPKATRFAEQKAALLPDEFLTDGLVPEEQGPLEQTSYHATTADFTEFSAEKMGTGHGLSTHGWGVYVTDTRSGADWYGMVGAASRGLKYYHTYEVETPEDEELLDSDESAKTLFERAVAIKGGKTPERTEELKLRRKQLLASAQKLVEFLSSLPESVAEFIAPEGGLDKVPGKKIYSALLELAKRGELPGQRLDMEFEGQTEEQKANQSRSLFLLDHGIAGYKTEQDQTETGVTVIFDPKRVKIKGKRTSAAATGEPLLQTSRPTKTDTPEFKKWFGKSKVVDDAGEPLVVYHGTTDEIKRFESRGGLAGHFSTESAAHIRLSDRSEDASGGRGAMLGASILPVYLSIQNPVRMDDVHFDEGYTFVKELVRRKRLTSAQAKKILGPYGPSLEGTEIGTAVSQKQIQAAVDILRAQGFDGIVYKNFIEGGGDDTYIPFSPGQVKSAIGNAGTFDPNDPSILKQESPASWYSPMPGVEPFQRDAETRWAKQIEESGDKLRQEYDKLPDTAGGKVLDVDAMRVLFPDYRENPTIHVLSTQKPAGATIEKWFYEALKKKPTGPVMFLSGGGGSGKSTARGIGGPLHPAFQESEIVYDGVLGNFAKAVARIEASLDSGRTVIVGHVYTPLEVAAKRVDFRYRATGRGIIPEVLTDDHVMSQAVFLQLYEKYKNTPGIKFLVADSSGKEAFLSSVDKVSKNAYTKGGLTESEAIGKFLPVAQEVLRDEQREIERQIQEAQVRFRDASRQGAGRLGGADREGDGGQPERGGEEEQGARLAEEGDEDRILRGAYYPDVNTLALFAQHNQTTFLHEMAHAWLKHSLDHARSGKADAAFMQFWSGIAKALGIDDSQDRLTREQQEKWARWNEAYLMEGKAPSTELRAAFNAVKRWFLSIYQNLSGLERDSGFKVELSDEVRSLLDRVYATDEQISEAQAAAGYQPEEVPGLDPQASAEVRRLQLEARASAEEILLKDAMKTQLANRDKVLAEQRVKVKKEVEDEVARMPIVLAMDDLQERLGKGTPAAAWANRFRDNQMSQEQLTKFLVVAEVAGMSPDELVAAVTATPSKTELVRAEVEKRMAAFDRPNREQMREKALEAIHSDQAAELLALERAILTELVRGAEIRREVSARRRTEASLEAAAVKAQARAILEKKTAKEASSFRVFFTAERNAAIRVSKAIAKKDFAAAAKAKREQLLNHALAAESLRIKTEVAASARLLVPFQTRKDLMGMPYSFVRQIDDLLVKRGLAMPHLADEAAMLSIARQMDSHGEDPFIIANATGLVKDQNGNWVSESLTELVARLNDDYHAITLPDSVFAANPRQGADMTVAEMRDLRYAVKLLAELGRKYERFLSAFIKVDMKTAAKELRDSVEALVGRPYANDRKLGSSYDSKLAKSVESISRLPDSVTPLMVNLLTITTFLDGGQNDGPAHRLLYRILKDAERIKLERMEKTMAEVNAIFAKHYTPKEMVAYKEKTLRFGFLVNEDGSPRYLSREEALSILLNWGNDGNRERIRTGFGQFVGRNFVPLSDQNVQEILNALEKRDYDFAQDVWDHLQTYWPDIVQLEMAAKGVQPEPVKAVPVESKFGTYRGGYYPIAYDFEKSATAANHADAKNALYKQYSTSAAHTERGHAEARVASVKRPVRLSLDVLFNHLENVVHDLAFRPAVIDMNRLLRMSDVRIAIENAIGLDGFRSIENTLKATASDQGDHVGAWDGAIRSFRTSFTVAALGLRLVKFVPDLATNLGISVWELGPSRVRQAITRFIASPLESKTFVDEKSVLMRQRSKLMERDIHDISRKWEGRQSALKMYAFTVQALSDQMLSYPLWLEVYNHNLSEKGERVAAQIADEAIIKTFGSGSEVDRVGVQRGSEAQKLLSMFYSWNSMMFNRLWLEGKLGGLAYEEGNVGEVIGHAARLTVYGVLLPAFLEALLSEAFRNAKGEDREGRKRRVLSRILMQPFGYVWLVRDVAGYAVSKAVTGRATYRLSPIESAVESLLSPLAEGTNIAFTKGKHFDQKYAESAARGAAAVLGYPQLFNDIFFNVLDWHKKKSEMTWRDFLSREKKK